VFICGYNPFVSIGDNVARVQERIAAAAARAGRRAEQVTLVAVSKTVSAQRIRDAYRAGVRHFGENRVQEWEGKAAALADLPDAVWHLVGHLQSNKARRAVDLFAQIDSVDSPALALRLDRLVEERQNIIAENAETQRSQSKLPVLLEVRLAPEESKHGVEPEELAGVVDAVQALPHLELRGLMCIPPYCENPEDARPYFRRLFILSDALRREGRELRNTSRSRLSVCHSGGAPVARRNAAHRATEEPQGFGSATNVEAQQAASLQELSMGMSHDFEVAIEEGATQVRIGTAIFGERT
jgi:hypothetical protein